MEVFSCPDAVRRHALSPQFLSTLHSLSERDYPGEQYFHGTEIDAIDMDRYEKSLSGDDNRTVDAAIGIATGHDDGELRDPRLMLVELRMGFRNPRHITAKPLREKTDNSRRRLLSADTDCKIDPTVVFVFNPKAIQSGISVIRRLATEVSASNEWKAMTPDELCDYINYGKTPLYMPSAGLKDMAGRLLRAATGPVGEFEPVLNEAKKNYDICRTRFRMADCGFIAGAIAEAITAMECRRDSMDSDDADYLDILKEGLPVPDRNLNV